MNHVMSILTYNVHKISICFLALMATASALGQGTLIGPSTRNGCFEDGVASPWFGDVTVIQDPTFASQGDWFAIVQSTIRPASLIQNVPANPNGGPTFLLAFDARIGAPGFDSVSAQMSTRTMDGLSLSASVTPLIVPPLVASAWQPYQIQLQLPANWDSDNINFSILFNKNEPLGGTTHFGYLDNITLQQIPEPCTLALLGLVTCCFAAHLFHKRQTKKCSNQ